MPSRTLGILPCVRLVVRQQGTNFRIKLRTCQGDDTMWHLVIVTSSLSPYVTFAKILLVPQLTSLSSVANRPSR
jgi:hypothetical protein